MKDDELTAAEEQALRAIKRDEYPPSRIEASVVQQLKREGLIRSSWSWTPVLVAVAAALVAFVVGLNVPRAARISSPPPGPRFAILLYPGTIPLDAPKRRDEYAAWARQIAAGGTSVQGEELSDEADDPSGPRGFFIITAPDAEHARAIAATCPHLKYGGRIVVRRIG